jgi:hypothetical protein
MTPQPLSVCERKTPYEITLLTKSTKNEAYPANRVQSQFFFDNAGSGQPSTLTSVPGMVTSSQVGFVSILHPTGG